VIGPDWRESAGQAVCAACSVWLSGVVRERPREPGNDRNLGVRVGCRKFLVCERGVGTRPSGRFGTADERPVDEGIDHRARENPMPSVLTSASEHARSAILRDRHGDRSRSPIPLLLGGVQPRSGWPDRGSNAIIGYHERLFVYDGRSEC